MALSLLLSPSLSAAIIAQHLGTSSAGNMPSDIIGGFTMTRFGADPLPPGAVSEIPTPTGGKLSFDTPLQTQFFTPIVPTPGGGSDPGFSIRYTGTTYMRLSPPLSPYALTLTLPPGTDAFYLFVKNGSPGDTVVGFDVSGGVGAGIVSIKEFPAQGWAFYGTDGDKIEWISITATAGFNTTIGEFAISGSMIPEPSQACAAVALALVGFTCVHRVWRRSRP